MCGISGIFDARMPPGDEVVERQVALLHHRGPDAAGHFRSDCGVIAQNRLSVIDLHTGDPPITNEDGSIGVCLNGEIYNFAEHRKRLLEAGHTLSSAGDTEVIAHLAEDHSPEGLARALDGMFAFAVLDRRRRRLVLGRDRLGKKPLYYWFAGSRLIFGSELKAVLADPQVPRTLDPGAIEAFLTFGYVPTPRTFFAGVQSLPPGHVLTVEAGGAPRVERYWAPPRPRPGRVDDMQGAAHELRGVLRQAVSKRMVADVPLGAFLSGGIDSSTIVAMASDLSEAPLSTFTIGFDDADGFDERPFARTIAARFGTDHHEFVVQPNAVDLIERLVHHHDQPFGDSSAVPTFILNELTSQHVTVALSGDGGDELFGGYERFAAGLMSERFSRIPRRARDGLVKAAGLMPDARFQGRAGRFQRFARSAGRGLPDAYLAWVSFLRDEDRAALQPRRDDWPRADFRRVWHDTAGLPTLDRILELNLRTYLLDDLLVKADRMSMAHGLEVRSPFLDTELVAFAATLAPKLKVRGLDLKRVLKAAMRDILPDSILARRKWGFGVPLDRWFREDLDTYVRSTLGAPDARVRSHLESVVVDRIVHEHASGQANHGHVLWSLLTLEVFLRQQDW